MQIRRRHGRVSRAGSGSLFLVLFLMWQLGLVDALRAKESVAFRIGSADFTPGGFVDFENVFRRSSTGNCGQYSRYKLMVYNDQGLCVRKDGPHSFIARPLPTSSISGNLFQPLVPARLNSVGTLVRPPTASFVGWYVSGDVAGSFNTLNQTELFKTTDVVTNRFSDSSSAMGGGFSTGILFSPWNNNILIGPSASFDFFKQDTFHTFPPGPFFLGQTINAIGTLNGQIGVVATPGLFLFGEVGAAFVNLDQNLNFSGPVTSVNQYVTGLNLGGGVAYQPPGWQIGGNPLAIFTQINRIILPAVTFENPGSPGFTYRNDNEITMIKVGARIQFQPLQATRLLGPIRW